MSVRKRRMSRRNTTNHSDTVFLNCSYLQTFFYWESFNLQGTSLASAKSGFNGAVRLVNIGHYLILVFLALAKLA